MSARAVVGPLLVTCALALPSGGVRAADPPAETQASVAAAFSAFRTGEKAFEKREFLKAAHAFEIAYRLARHHDALWNAARSWEEAGERARAAGRYDRFLREAPKDAPDRDDAARSLAALAVTLGQIDVRSTGLLDLAVDDLAVDEPRTYVAPGPHVVRGRAGGREIVKPVVVAAGAVVVVTIEPEPAQPAAQTTILVVHGGDAVRPPFLRRSAKIALIAGSTLAAVSTAITVASGVDTRAARDRFSASPTLQNHADGRAKQARTNVLVGVSAGLGALTLATTLSLGDWKRAPIDAPKGTASVGIGADGSVSVRGCF